MAKQIAVSEQRIPKTPGQICYEASGWTDWALIHSEQQKKYARAAAAVVAEYERRLFSKGEKAAIIDALQFASEHQCHLHPKHSSAMEKIKAIRPQPKKTKGKP